jgi:hypothetical protein
VSSQQAATGGDLESLLRRALAPVDPPEDLAERLETTLTSLTELAADELEAWELGSMRDPRNWVRPVAAVAVSSVAGAGLVVLRVRSHQKRRKATSKNNLEFTERTLRAAVGEARRLLDR